MTLATGLGERYVRHLAARHFAEVHWRPGSSAGDWDTAIPTLFLANHTNWWDGFLAFLVTRALGLRFHVLMEERQLTRYRGFRRFGALPVRRGRPREAYADLEAAGRRLRPGVGLWIFPQGGRRPPSERPLRWERGAAHLALGHQGPLRICPVGFRYAFVGEQRPEAFVLVGEDRVRRAEAADSRKDLATALAGRLETTLDALDRLVAAERLDGFLPLVTGGLSANKRLDRFRHAVGLLPGPFEARNG